MLRHTADPTVSQSSRQQIAADGALEGTAGQNGGAELQAIVERVRKAAPGLILVLCGAHGALNASSKDTCEVSSCQILRCVEHWIAK